LIGNVLLPRNKNAEGDMRNRIRGAMAGYNPKQTLDDVCKATGCNREQVIAVVGTVFEVLHKMAFCDETAVIRSVMECEFQFGLRACYHLGGLLKEGRRLKVTRDGSWYESYYASRPVVWQEFDRVVENWMQERTEERKLLDEERKTQGS
jgi:hypothetical protein